MQYEDFAIEIRSPQPESYAVEVRASDLQRATGVLKLPFDAEDAWTRFQERRKTPVPAEDPASAELGLGVPLFLSLFPQRIAATLQQTLLAVEQLPAVGDTKGLRLRLSFGAPPDRPLRQDDLLRADYIRFGALPWELLCDPETGQPLALNPATPIVRTLDGSRPARPLEVELPFRVLVVCCLPQSLGVLDVDGEKAQINRALANKEVVTVDFLDDPPIDQLGRLVRSGRYHVLHFIGHGGFDLETGEGHLCFTRPDAPADDDVEAVTGRQFAQVLSGCPDLRLVVLNACRSGQSARYQGQSPFTATAAAVSLTGVPAVIAMQHSISDQAAITFSANFYESLATGSSLEEALADARRAISRQGSLDWATPALFLRSRDGRLLRLNGPATHDREGESPQPLMLGVRSFSGWNEDRIEKGDRRLFLYRYFDQTRFKGRYILDPASWNGEIRSHVQRFALKSAAERRPLELLFAAHQSIAFALGYFLEAKSGVRIGVLQPTAHQSMEEQGQAWYADKGEMPAGPLWKDENDEILLNPEAPDVAVAVGISTPVLQLVEDYIRESKLPVGRILVMTLAPDPGAKNLLSGAHAWGLAQSLANRLHGRSAIERRGTIHLFASAPNAFLVFLGQLCTTLGKIQLYEFDKETQLSLLYEPSISLPCPQASGPSPLQAD